MLKIRQEKAREKSQLCHPRDRRVRQMEKKDKRVNRLAAQKDRLKVGKALQNMRNFWFREQCIALGHTTSAVSEEFVLPLVQLYINRNCDELEELKACRNPPMGRIKQLETIMESEMDAFRTAKGIEVPVLTTADDVEILTQIWDGEPETVSVVPVAGVSLGRNTINGAHLQDLAARLKPMTDVRAVATSIMPKRSQRFTEKGAAAAAARKVSVKSMSAAHTPEAIKERSRAQALKKQQERLKTNRRAALDKVRAHGNDDDDDDDEVL